VMPRTARPPAEVAASRDCSRDEIVYDHVTPL
jgi:hypothetical protein